MSMTNEHRCDTSTDPNNTPLTRARVRRLLAACLQENYHGVDAVFDEISGCSACLQKVTLILAGAAARYMPHPELHALMAVDLELEAALEDRGDDG